jgi:ABC-type antimicrobial peptide transport system ATPase subunit
MLRVRNLGVRFGDSVAVEGLDLDVAAGEVLGLVGESGSGKSVSMMALMGLIDPPGQVQAEAVEFMGRDLLGLRPRERRQVIGREIAMVFQDALTALNPATPWATRSPRCCAPTWACAARRCASARWSCWSRSRSRMRAAACAPTRTSCRAA